MGQNQLINYNLEPVCQATVINTLSGWLLNTRLYRVKRYSTDTHVSAGMQTKQQVDKL